MIYTYIITSILTEREVDFSKRANFGNRLGPTKQKTPRHGPRRGATTYEG